MEKYASLKTGFVSISLFIILSGCNKKDGIEYSRENGKLVYRNFQNGTLKAKSYMNDDSIQNGRTIYYYDNGKKKRSTELKNGKVNGIDSIFHESGRIKHWAQFLNDTILYATYNYYDTIRTYWSINSTNDTILSKWPVFKSYHYYNLNGENVFNTSYEVSGKIKNIGGRGIADVGQDQSDSLYTLEFYLATPPFTKSAFRYGKIINNEIQDIREVEIDLDYNSATINWFVNPETDLGIAYYDIYRDSTLIYSDTLKFQIKTPASPSMNKK